MRSASRLRAIACGLLVACGGEAADQAGAPEIEGAPLAIEEAAVARVGVVEGDTLQQLHQVVSPFLLADGRIVVPLQSASTIHVFGPDGEYERSLGRRGSGPGEFQHLLFAWARGDTIEAFDARLLRISRFRPDGSLEDVNLTTTLPDLSGVAGPLGDGWAIGGVASGGFGGGRDVVAIHRFDRSGTDRGEIATVEGMARYVVPDLGGGPEPLSPRSVLAVRHHRVYVGESRTPALRVFGPDGLLEREITWTPAPSQVTADELLATIIDSAVALAPPDRAEYTRRRLEGAPAPGPLSVFWHVLIDDDGFLWIRPYDPLQHSFALDARLGPGGTWAIFAPDGAAAGLVAMPAGIEPFHITSNAVLGLARDEMDVESVRVHTLRRR
ncbi:MAG: hypothetical protein L0271_12950 [Gemmatimonadetes bacterium]|nr:hypothetical protein [Gemmatimonadota bacterium]